MSNERDLSLPHYLAVDLETTGLDENSEQILEVAAVVVDGNLNGIDGFHARVRCPSDVLASMDPYVLDMHLATGLVLTDGETITTRPEAWPLDKVELAFSRFVLAHFPRLDEGDYRPPLLGHSVHFDRGFMAKHLPAVDSLVSHRNMDARSVQLLAPQHAWPRAPEGTKHTAQADIVRSIEVLRMGRRLIEAGIAAEAAAASKAADIADLEAERRAAVDDATRPSMSVVSPEGIEQALAEPEPEAKPAKRKRTRKGATGEG